MHVVTDAGQRPPPLPGPFAAVVLDLDGLLVRTEELWTHAKEILFERYGTTFRRADHLAVFGSSERDTARHFTKRLGLGPARADHVRLEYIAIARELLETELEVMDGARELVSWLHGRVPLGLASNTRRELVERILARVDLLSAFDAIVTGDDAAPKPAPDLYLLACARLGVEPASAVALEDSPTGVRAARLAGLTCVGVPSAPEVELAEAHHVVASLRDLLLDEPLEEQSSTPPGDRVPAIAPGSSARTDGTPAPGMPLVGPPR